MAATRILIVEDDPQIVRALAPALAVSGWDVTAARSIAEATARIGDGGWGAVVLDLGLPDGDGMDLIEPIRSSGTPVVVITACPEPAEKDKALSLGASAFLSKPFAAPELVRLLDALA